MEVILKITEIKVSANYAKSGLTCSPMSDVLYLVDVPNDCYVDAETGEKVFTTNGAYDIL